MTIFNLKSCRFEVYNNQEKFLAVQIDQLRDDFKEVIHFFENSELDNEVLPLNNEGDDDLEKSLHLFSEENISFLTFLDFYRNENIAIMSEIILNYKNGTTE